jgi:hypothetical protein
MIVLRGVVATLSAALIYEFDYRVLHFEQGLSIVIVVVSFLYVQALSLQDERESSSSDPRRDAA